MTGHYLAHVLCLFLLNTPVAWDEPHKAGTPKEPGLTGTEKQGCSCHSLSQTTTPTCSKREACRFTWRISDPQGQQVHQIWGCQGLYKPVTIIYVKLKKGNPQDCFH